MSFEERVRKIQARLDERGLDAAMFFSPPNLAYISGFYPHTPWYPDDLWRLAPVIVRPKADPIIIGTTVSTQRLRDTCWIKDVRSYDEYTEDGPAFLARVLADEGLATGWIGIEEDVLVFRTVKELTARMPQVRFEDVTDLMLQVRAVKDAEEQVLMRKAGEIIVQGMKAAIAAIRPGVSEKAVAAAAENAMRLAGADRFTEETMVLSGRRTLHTRDRASDKIIEENDIVILDMGTIYQGYCTDISRTVFAGKPSPEQRAVYELNVEIHRATMELIRPGITAHELDAYARRRYAECQFKGAHTAHLVGHGLGLQFHEIPLLMPGQHVVLEPGMTFSIEPSVRVPGITGVRIEDNVLVTEDGYELLSKDLPISFI